MDTLHSTGIDNGAIRTVNMSASPSFVSVVAAVALLVEARALSGRSPGRMALPKDLTLILFTKAASGDRCVHK